MNIIYFKNTDSLHGWFEQHHDKMQELWVGFFKKASGVESITWSESVDEALCFGWIDGIRKSVDADRYCIRFTPRRPGSNWSDVNLKKVTELIGTGRMQPVGLAVYENRKPERERVYSYENRHKATFSGDLESIFRQHGMAWSYFNAQAPSYQKATIRWVMSASQETTRLKRLQELITSSAAGEYIKAMQRGQNQKKG
jgi:uncharacterized protein YdeI (YjbR/CyaY-like superfamily)